MGEADQTLEQVTLPAEPDQYDVESAQPTCKMPAIRADATEEIAAADILESVGAAKPASRPRIRKVGPSRIVRLGRASPALLPKRIARPAPAPPVEAPREVEEKEPASIGPIAVDVPSRPEPPPSRPSCDSTVYIRALPPPPRRLQAVVIGVMSASLVILTLAAVRSYLATFEVEPPMPALASAPPKRAAPPPPPPPPVRAATPTTGTIMLAKGVRGILVDGARIGSTSAVVPCGAHNVTAQGKMRAVDVPCGGTYIITP
jgi:hypothetical protein